MEGDKNEEVRLLGAVLFTQQRDKTPEAQATPGWQPCTHRSALGSSDRMRIDRCQGIYLWHFCSLLVIWVAAVLATTGGATQLLPDPEQQTCLGWANRLDSCRLTPISPDPHTCTLGSSEYACVLNGEEGLR